MKKKIKKKKIFFYHFYGSKMSEKKRIIEEIELKLESKNTIILDDDEIVKSFNLHNYSNIDKKRNILKFRYLAEYLIKKKLNVILFTQHFNHKKQKQKNKITHNCFEINYDKKKIKINKKLEFFEILN